MPKLIVKQDLPEPSFQEKLADVLRKVLPAALILTLAATAWSFYLATRTPVEMPDISASVTERLEADSPLMTDGDTTVVSENVQAPPSAAAGLPEGVELPPGFCPLFGPEAESCKPGDDASTTPGETQVQ